MLEHSITSVGIPFLCAQAVAFGQGGGGCQTWHFIARPFARKRGFGSLAVVHGGVKRIGRYYLHGNRNASVGKIIAR
jgi:hypothetical protein